MKTCFLMLISFFTLVTCNPNRMQNPNCRFILDINVNEAINLNLPQYSQLQYTGNSVFISTAGNAGIIVASVGNDFLAWDAADPNHEQSNCSVLVNSGLVAKCGCPDGNTYSLVNGLPMNNGELPCTLKYYRVERSGNTLYISN